MPRHRPKPSNPPRSREPNTRLESTHKDILTQAPHIILSKNLRDISKEYLERQFAVMQRGDGNREIKRDNASRHDGIQRKRMWRVTVPEALLRPFETMSPFSRDEGNEITPSDVQIDPVPITPTNARRAMICKAFKILLHVVPSYYILLTRSPMHLLMYNLVIYNALGEGQYQSPIDRLRTMWGHRWMRVALCVVALVARLGIVLHRDKDHEQDEQDSKTHEPSQQSTPRKILSVLSTSLFHTVPLLLSLHNLLTLIKLKSRTQQSNGLFLSVYRNPIVFYQWKEDRAAIVNKMQSVSAHAAWRAALDALLILMLLSRRIMRFVRRRRHSWYFWRRKRKDETSVVQEEAPPQQDATLPVPRNAKRLSIKSLLIRIRNALRYLRFLKYTNRPLHVIIFELFYYHVDWEIFLHGVSLVAHLLLWKKCQRMEPMARRLPELRK